MVFKAPSNSNSSVILWTLQSASLGDAKAKNLPGTTSCPLAEFLSHKTEKSKTHSWLTVFLMFHSFFLLVSFKLILVYRQSLLSPLLVPELPLPARLMFDPTIRDLCGQISFNSRFVGKPPFFYFFLGWQLAHPL